MYIYLKSINVPGHLANFAPLAFFMQTLKTSCHMGRFVMSIRLQPLRYRKYFCDECPNSKNCDKLCLKLSSARYEGSSVESQEGLRNKLKRFGFRYPLGRKPCVLAGWKSEHIDDLMDH
jgi:hypothetical protein